MKNIILFIVITSFLFACNKNKIVQQSEIEPFLQNKFAQKKLVETKANYQFWEQKLKIDNNYVNALQLAYSNIDLFGQTGKVKHLLLADSFFNDASAKVQHKENSIYLALTQNAIMQHQFNKAKKYLDTAALLNADAYHIALVSFDINMELGKYSEAVSYLNKIKTTKNEFDYLIRLAKYQDYLGEAEISIATMEKALQISMLKNNKGQQLWLLTNIADMYTHENKLQKAYNLFKKSLTMDSSNLYALQQIANISSKVDDNDYLSNKIWNYIATQKTEPSLLLAKANIEKQLKSKLHNQFIQQTTNAMYGNMYNAYNIDLLLNETKEYNKGLQLSLKEMENRATPSSYSWLALAYYKNNEVAKAQQIIMQQVLNKTHEPLALYNAAIIIRQTDEKSFKKLVQQCNQSNYELGKNKLDYLNSL